MLTTSSSCSSPERQTIQKVEVNKKIIKTFSLPEDYKLPEDTYQLENSWEDNATVDMPVDSIEPDPNVVVETVNYSDIKDGPLFMRGTKRHIWEFLWYNQYQDILSKYNTYDPNKLAEAKYSISSLESLSFPLIVDWLEQVFPERTEDMIQSDELFEYRDSLINEKDFIVVKNSWWKYVLWYYKWWKLYLATHVSIWTWNNTPEWFFRLWAKYKRNVSRKYNNAAMPYTIVVTWNICMHQWRVTWTKLSHGCIRVPWLYQQIMFYDTQEWTPIVLLP